MFWLSAQIVLLANWHALVAEDVVGRGHVEIEVREAAVEEIGLSGQLGVLAADLDGDGAVVGADEFFRGEGREIVDALLQACLEGGEGDFIVGPTRQRLLGKA